MERDVMHEKVMALKHFWFDCPECSYIASLEDMYEQSVEQRPTAEE